MRSEIIREKTNYNKVDTDNKDIITILKEHKIYEVDSRLLLCPNCHHYSVDYFPNRADWWCYNCAEIISYYEYPIEFTDEDKYHIYKLHGLEALSILTNSKLRNTKSFVSSYFKKSCIKKKEKCLYYDFLGINSDKSDKNLNNDHKMKSKKDNKKI